MMGRPRMANGVLGGISDSGLPLQLSMAWLIICATPVNEQGQQEGYYSVTFISAILDLVAREAFEVCPTPSTFSTLQVETDRLIRREAVSVARLIARRRARGQAIPDRLEMAAEFHSWMEIFKSRFDEMNEACAFVDTIEREIRNRINEHDEELEGPEPIERRSPLGVYFRTMLVSLRKLSFDQTTVLAAQIAEWCGKPFAEEDSLPLAWKLHRNRSDLDHTSETIASMKMYESAFATGDYTAALAALRRFYDYQLPKMDRPMHQHALLNIATFHYNTGGLQSAIEAVDGAIRHARRANDPECLQKCTALKYRITTELEGLAFVGSQEPLPKNQPLPLRQLAKNVMPHDELWSVKAAVDLGEPVPVAFRRVYTALSLHLTAAAAAKGEREDWMPVQPVHLSPSSWHAVQAGLWALLGSDTLADLHENMAFTAPDMDDETRMEVVLARSDRMCNDGKVDESLALLLDGSTVDAMAAADYRRWAAAVWGILERSAVQQADGDALAVINGLRGSTGLVRLGPGGPLREQFDTTAPPPPRARGIIFAHGEVTAALHRADKLLAAHAPAHLILPDVLSALQLASSLGLWPVYAAASVFFAESLLAMDLPAKAEEEIERVWDQLRGQSLARAALVRAKAHAAIALDSPDSARVSFAKAAEYADLALSRSSQLLLRSIHRDAAALRSMVAEIAGLPSPRLPDLPAPNGTERARRVGEIVRLVGVRVAEGWKM